MTDQAGERVFCAYFINQPAHRAGVGGLRTGPPVRCITTAQLVTELVEAADERILSHVVARLRRLDLLCLDELGYVHIDPRGAELLFQIITEREDRASVAIATKLPFSEWGHRLPRPTPGRRHRRPRHIQRPHHRDRHRVSPTTHQQNHHPRQTGQLGRRPTLRVKAPMSWQMPW